MTKEQRFSEVVMQFCPKGYTPAEPGRVTPSRRTMAESISRRHGFDVEAVYEILIAVPYAYVKGNLMKGVPSYDIVVALLS